MIRVPGDKSISHRALLLSALAEGESRLEGVLPGADCRSTAAILRLLGVEVPSLPADGSPFPVRGKGLHGLKPPGGPLDCGNSGTTARLLLGLLSGLSIESVLTGDASLQGRPMARITEPLGRAGARFREEGEPGRLPIRVLEGTLSAIDHTSAVASAQVKSALLLAGLGAGAPVRVVEPVASRDHSERMLRRLGVDVREEGEAPHQVRMPAPPSRLDPMEIRVPGDVSSAAFLLALGLLGGAGNAGLAVADVGLNPTRAGLLAVIRRMGATLEIGDLREADDPAGEPAGTLGVAPQGLSGVEVGGREIPALIDEIPVLAVLAARAQGTTVIRDAGELRVKESDRIRALALNLTAVGAQVEELADGLVIHGSDRPLEGSVKAYHDHRIAMAFGVLGALDGNRIEVDDRDVADVSFPGFWALLDRLSRPSGRRTRSPGEEGSGDGPTRPSVASGEASRSPADAPPSPATVSGARAPVITIDGPAGSGKSSTAREVARRLGLRHLDSGALYRGLTLALIEAGIPPEEWDGRGLGHLRGVEVKLVPAHGHFQVLLEGRDPGPALRSPEVNEEVARLAAIPHVRELVLGPLRSASRVGGVVADGRDMGTVVLPDADLKVYLTASLRERARRRLLQEGRVVSDPVLGEVARELARRDAVDRERAVAPLRRPDGALEVDTTALSFEEQVDRIVSAAGGAHPLTGTTNSK